MEARPGQAIQPRHQVFVERLVLVPKDDNSQLSHDFLIPLSTSAICQFNSLPLPVERRASELQ
jgi:hypothetical protein